MPAGYYNRTIAPVPNRRPAVRSRLPPVEAAGASGAGAYLKSRRTWRHATSTRASAGAAPPARSRPTWRRGFRPAPANNSRAIAGARCPQAEPPQSERGSALFDLQRAVTGGGHHLSLVHGSDTRRAYVKHARVHHLQQVEELLLALRKKCLENGHAIVVQFTAREPILPPWRPAFQLILVVALNEFRARGNGVFDHHILPFRTRDRQPHGDDVSRRHGASQRRGVIHDLVAIAAGHEPEIIAQDVERNRAGVFQPFFVGEVFGARGVIQPARAAGSNADVIDARLYLGIIERQLRRVDAGGLIELACQHRLIVHQIGRA